MVTHDEVRYVGEIKIICGSLLEKKIPRYPKNEI